MRAFNIPKKKFNTSSYTRFVKPLQKIFHSSRVILFFEQ
uniref:Uncharacterized protein n=1 Tax=uncultured Desulfobacterium sp. TaxID=201089 RepID=E1YKP1_9BACT|nr:unknown protein [uncultured Desulfobacterium sp.]